MVGKLEWRRGVYLTVRGTGKQGKEDWYCIPSQHVYSTTKKVTVQWLEEVNKGVYKKGYYDKVDKEFLLGRANFVRRKDSGVLQFILSSRGAGKQAKMIKKPPKTTAKTTLGNAAKKPAGRKRKADDTAKEERKLKAPEKKKKEKEPKPPKEKRPKVDKSDPNWKLKPNLNVVVLEKDPLFEEDEPVEFVSPTAHSRLTIRAVLTNNIKLLKDCVKNGKEISDLHVTRSMANEMTALRYALKMENIEAVKILLKKENGKIKRCDKETWLLPKTGTGRYNYRSLGIRHIRSINMSRGSREGNNAFLKDDNVSGYGQIEEKDLMSWNLSTKFINSLCMLKDVDLDSVLGSVINAVKEGHRKLAAEFIKKDLARGAGGSNQFSDTYVKALLGTGDPWLDSEKPLRENSVKKKANYENAQFTPLHAACVNPDTGPLEAMFKICPDIFLMDSQGWKLVHYAAGCEGTGPLEFLAAKGVNLEDPARAGKTPLMLACMANRPNNIQFILDKIADGQHDEEDATLIAKFGRGGINKVGKDSWAALHHAVYNDKIDAVETLLKNGADANKQLNTKHDKVTPLMMAAANGSLPMVKLLCTKSRIEKRDRFRRTALMHAVMNGAANVVTYLLSRGADINAVDSSGNSNLHYACAYGWWFCVKILCDYGANLNPMNEWKLTPLSIAILKGNKGIGHHLSQLPDVDVEVRDDTGRTLLLLMLNGNGEGISDAVVKEIIGFVEDHKADPAAVDNEGRNALHYVAEIKPDRYEDVSPFLKRIKKLTDFFLMKKIDSGHVSKDGEFAIQAFLRNLSPKSIIEDTEDKAKVDKAYESYCLLASSLLKNMVQKADRSLDESSKKGCRNLFLEFFKVLDISRAALYSEIFEEMRKLLYKLSQGKNIRSFEFLDEILSENDENYTIFSKICDDYLSKDINESEEESNKKVYDKKQWTIYLNMLKDFMSLARPRLSFKAKDKAYHHLFLSSFKAKDDFMLFELMLDQNAYIYVKDSEGKDALYFAIEKNYVGGAKSLLDRGAEINRVRKAYDSKGKLLECDTPLLWALSFGNPDIIELLLRLGAKTFTLPATQKSAIHQAVISCKANNNEHGERILGMLIDNGADVNEKDDKMRTPLHMAVNLSSDRPDSSLELEMLLISKGARLDQKDIRGRTPLHYAFVKMGNHTDDTFMDPIQIVSVLAEDMRAAMVCSKDVFGLTALHYAAYRGATVSCLLLMQKGADIEARDHLDRTPLCFAVTGKHDGCALMLIQKNANVNVNMVSPPFKAYDKEEEGAALWKYLPKHFDQTKTSVHSLFHGIVLNDWLGIIYVVMDKIEDLGISFAEAIDVALRQQKLQFAKNLVCRITNKALLRESKKNLITTLAAHTSGQILKNEKLIRDLFSIFCKAGIGCNTPDDAGCFPIHFACLNHNKALIRDLLQVKSVLKNVTSMVSGKSVLAAYLWNLKTVTNEDQEILAALLSLGVDINDKFIIRTPSFDTGEIIAYNTSENLLEVCAGQIEITPLIMSVIRNDFDLMTFLIKHGADCDLVDSRGFSPLVYALKGSNTKMIDYLLKESRIMYSDVLEHAVVLDVNNPTSPSFDDETMFKKLLKQVGSITEDNLLKLSKLAMAHGAFDIFNSLAKKNKKLSAVKKMFKADENQIPKSALLYNNDAKEMMKELNEKLDDDNVDMEEESESKPPEGCTIKKGHIHDGYTVLMNKVNVGFGAWGMYNFYRMQIWKDSFKDLYVLFTNWGRIGPYETGQYQNTPYSTPDEAVAEFEKIFKSKSGNDWGCRNNFENKTNKYRLVKLDEKKKMKKDEIKFDLTTRKSINLSLPLGYLLKDISDVDMIKSTFCSEVDIDHAQIPYGRIEKSVVNKALTFLEEMKPIIKKKEKLEEKRYSSNNEKILEELTKIGEQLSEMSSEYYFLVPKRGFEYEKVSPVDSMDKYKEEQSRLNYVLEFEFTEAVLLGAMYKRQEIHPLEYVNMAIGKNIEQLEESSLESQLIMKYMYRSRGAADYRIWSVFRIGSQPLDPFSAPKKLLWHGTRKANLLSILNKGLIVEPPNAQRTGRAYGDGVYFADMFDKSINYTDCESVRYLLLCEVDLSTADPNDNYNTDTSKYGSVIVQGNHGPDKKMSLSVSDGYKIPLGTVKKTEENDGHHWYRPHMSEYVVNDESKIRVRYLVCIGNQGIGTLEELQESFLPDQDVPTQNGF